MSLFPRSEKRGEESSAQSPEPPLDEGGASPERATEPPLPYRRSGVTVSLPREPRFRQELLPTVQVVAGEQMLRFATVPEGGEIVIGRDADADLVLDHPSISRRHAIIGYPDSGQLGIEDCGSTNGVAINGYSVRQSAVRPGDLIELGAISLRLDLFTPDELSHLRRVQEKLASADTDPLTGLKSRAYCEDDLPEALQRFDENGHQVSAIFIDLDHFKAVNDTHGHAVGDEVLRAVAKIVLVEIRDEDTCVRYGGDELLVMLPRTDRDGAEEVAERIRCSFAHHDWQRTAAGLGLTASFGVAERRLGEPVVEWIARADQVLYAAKAGGRNRVGK